MVVFWVGRSVVVQHRRAIFSQVISQLERVCNLGVWHGFVEECFLYIHIAVRVWQYLIPRMSMYTYSYR